MCNSPVTRPPLADKISKSTTKSQTSQSPSKQIVNSGRRRSRCMRFSKLELLRRFRNALDDMQHKLACQTSSQKRKKKKKTNGIANTSTKKPQTGCADSKARQAMHRKKAIEGTNTSTKKTETSEADSKALHCQLAVLPFALRLNSRPLDCRSRNHNNKRPADMSPDDHGPAPKRLCVETKPKETSMTPEEVETTITRILAAETPEDVLGIDSGADDSIVLRAWKSLVLPLHPDKVACLSEWARAEAPNALHMVHEAKDELRRKQQEMNAEVPDMPQPETKGGRFNCSCAKAGARKFELRWKPHTITDPRKPVERYEIWAPKIFSDAGEAFEWILLATVPPLQNSFVFVEEAPTQQDVMWAADKVRVPFLPLHVYACNGKGNSEPCLIELPWGEKFPWLKGIQSLLCPSCCTVNAAWEDQVRCTNCSGTASVPVILRCPECHGEALWDDKGTVLSFRCCGRVAAQFRQQKQWTQQRSGGKNHETWHGKPTRRR